MKTLKLVMLVISVAATLISCHSGTSTNEIKGVWVATEETALKYPHGTQKGVLQIGQDQDGELTARGIFLWNDEYMKEWELVDIDYDHLTHQITIVDSDGDTYEGLLDSERKKISGSVHLQNNKKDLLDFIPADENLKTMLFYPRIPDTNGEVNYSYKIPEQLDDGLQTFSINNTVIDSESVIGLINEIIDQEYGRLESLLILKDNKLIVEEYFYGYNRTHLHPIHSCTKSITSLLIGIALEQHKSVQVDQGIFSFFPKYDSLKTKEKESINLKHVLTMTAGFEWDEFPREMYETGDWFQYILDRPMENKPGEKFHYNSGCTILLGGVINFLEGKHANIYAEEFLFAPLGISEYLWETHKNGTPQCGGGLHLLPRDMAKIGLLVLNDGRWQNEQIVSEKWIRESTIPRVPESDFFDYGYQWWHRSKNNQQWWEDSIIDVKDEHDMIFALGTGGQLIIIVKDLSLVVVTTASDYDNDSSVVSKVAMAIEKIIPLITNVKL